MACSSIPFWAFISIHALREEGDRRKPRGHRLHWRFLSTPSARRATSFPPKAHFHRVISIHALREEGDHGHSRAYHFPAISIHALREEGDRAAFPCRIGQENFYPRPPRGGRHGRDAQPARGERISIHALREEGDPASTIHRTLHLHFYPRPPRGGRLALFYASSVSPPFLSTPSARRATSRL